MTHEAPDPETIEDLTTRLTRLTRAQEISGIGSWDSDLVSGRVYWSPQMHRLVGTDPLTDTPSPRSLLEVTHPDDRERVGAAITLSWQNGETYVVEHRVLRRDGETRVMVARGMIELDAAGVAIRSIGTAMDVTEDRRVRQEWIDAHEAMERRAQMMAAAERLAGTGSWSNDVARGEVIWSEEMNRLFGLAPDAQPPGIEDYLRIVHPDDREHVRREIEAALSTASEYQYEHRVVVDGETRLIDVLGRPERIVDGVAEKVTGTAEDITRKRRLELELAAVHEEVRTQSTVMEQAQRIAGIGSWSYEMATGETLWSRQMHIVMGTDPAVYRPSRESHFSFVHPQDHQTQLERVADFDATGVGKRHDYRIIRPDGAVRIVESFAEVGRDADGKVVRRTGTTQDVTTFRETQHQLVEARDLLDQLVGAATEQAIIGTDPRGYVNLYNQGAQRMLGWTAEELLGTQHYLAVHDQDELAERFEQAARAGRPVEVLGQIISATWPGMSDADREWTYIRKDGTRLRVQLSISRTFDAAGELAGYVGIAGDVTEQRRAERERDEHAQMLRAVIENNQSIIYVKDLQGRYLLINHAYETAHDVTEEEVLGTTDELRNPELAPIWHANNVRAIDGPLAIEEYADLKDGRHEYDAVKLPLYDAAGRVYAICGLSLDITERKQAERDIAGAVVAMRHARDEALAMNAAKSGFLATMSHEIRTPMNAVIGLTGLLIDSPLDAEQRDLLETVRSSGDALLGIINDILDFSKFEAGNLDLDERPYDLQELVESTVASFSDPARDLALYAHVDDACPTRAVGDVARLRQVLSNLLSNAMKFTHAGHVSVQATTVREDDGTDMLRFEVADTGIGIAPENMDRLFKSFSQVDASTTRTYGGTGLGLALSRSLVRAMGGELWVTSEAGTGSTFGFSVPLVPAPDPTTEIAPLDLEAMRAALAGRHALIVDDHETSLRVLRMQLTTFGMQVTDMQSSRRALEIVQGGAVFDLAVLDLDMPDLDGVQLAQALRELPGGRMPLVMLSSMGRRAPNASGVFSATLAKPVRSDVLMRTLAESLPPGPARPTEPAVPAPPAAALPETIVPPETPSAPETTAPVRLRVLLAEDNPVNQKVGKLILSKLGHEVETADNGALALAAVQEHDYDVVLMDMHMPVMDGIEATRRIRAEVPAQRQPRIIAVTASVTLEDREACAAAGMNGFVPKPVRAAELAAALAERS